MRSAMASARWRPDCCCRTNSASITLNNVPNKALPSTRPAGTAASKRAVLNKRRVRLRSITRSVRVAVNCDCRCGVTAAVPARRATESNRASGAAPAAVAASCSTISAVSACVRKTPCNTSSTTIGANSNPTSAAWRCASDIGSVPSRYNASNSTKPALPRPPWASGVAALSVGSPVATARSMAARRSGCVAMSRPRSPVLRCSGVMKRTTCRSAVTATGAGWMSKPASPSRRWAATNAAAWSAATRSIRPNPSTPGKSRCSSSEPT